MKNTMRQAVSALALSAMALGAIAPSAFAYEDPKGGQHFDKGKWPRHYIAKSGPKITCPGPECTPEFVNDAIQRGVITPKEAKELRRIQSKSPTAAKGSVKPGNTPADPTASEFCPKLGCQVMDHGRVDSDARVKGANTLAIAGGLAAILGVALAVGSGESKPASP